MQRIVYYTLQKSIFVLLIVQLEQFIKVTNIKCIIQLKNPQKFSKLINPTFYKSRFFYQSFLILFELQIAQVKKNCNELMTLCYSRVNGLITYIFFCFKSRSISRKMMDCVKTKIFLSMHISKKEACHLLLCWLMAKKSKDT